jgi:hypothetical protein
MYRFATGRQPNLKRRSDVIFGERFRRFRKPWPASGWLVACERKVKRLRSLGKSRSERQSRVMAKKIAKRFWKSENLGDR